MQQVLQERVRLRGAREEWLGRGRQLPPDPACAALPRVRRGRSRRAHGRGLRQALTTRCVGGLSRA